MSYILIVDDEKTMRDILSLMLKRTKIPSKTARDGLQALDMISEERPALILLDVMMPVMSGKEMFNQLRSDPDLSDIPVLFISALARSKVDIPAIDHPDSRVEYLEKSDFSPDGLAQTIFRMLNDSSDTPVYKNTNFAVAGS